MASALRWRQSRLSVRAPECAGTIVASPHLDLCKGDDNQLPPGWAVGGLEPEPSSWTSYSTLLTSTMLGASSYRWPPAMTAATLTVIPSVHTTVPTAVFSLAIEAPP